MSNVIRVMKENTWSTSLGPLKSDKEIVIRLFQIILDKFSQG